MTGPTNAPVPGEHPDHDLLADLAAEVLADDLAVEVQQHVIGCRICASLLAEAEGIRSLLRQGEPEVMPDAVYARLTQALSEVRHQDDTAVLRFTGATSAVSTDRDTDGAGRSSRRRARHDPVGNELTDTSTRIMRPVGSDPGRRISRSGPSTAAMPTGGPPTGSNTAAISRLNRMSRPAQSARRQAREEERADRPSRLVPVFWVAAAVIVLLGAGGIFLQFRGGSADQVAASDSGASSTGGAASTAGGAPLLAAVQSTGTKYTKSTLNAQVDTLIRISQAANESGTRSAAATPSAAARKLAPEAAGSPAASSPGTQLLRSPEALRSCLAAIGAGDAQPVAIDLATYNGREAAIIVIPADGGGYDVWAVARDCRRGADGTIDVVTVAS